MNLVFFFEGGNSVPHITIKIEYNMYIIFIIFELSISVYDLGAQPGAQNNPHPVDEGSPLGEYPAHRGAVRCGDEEGRYQEPVYGRVCAVAHVKLCSNEMQRHPEQVD